MDYRQTIKLWTLNKLSWTITKQDKIDYHRLICGRCPASRWPSGTLALTKKRVGGWGDHH